MKHFFALPALLRPALLLASASQSSFSVNDDLLAFPQYEIKFTDDALSEAAAASLLVNHQKSHSSNNENELNTLTPEPPTPPNNTPSSSPPSYPIKYERLILDSYPFICSIPQVPTPNTTLTSSNDPNGTAKNDTLTQAEQAQELARARQRGWELLAGMRDHCVYYISGWWSYRFCYGKGIKQFHQLPQGGGGVPIHPPLEDPNVAGYELGVYRSADKGDEEGEGENGVQVAERRGKRGNDAAANAGWDGELVTSGDTRYLVQRLGGGTTCDLTGKQRTIEVQFHCNPQSADRISLIKETATCAYLMVIQTPRLCNDVAFMPPQKDLPNAISCSPILPEDEIEQYKRDMGALKKADRNAKIWEENLEAAAIFGIDLTIDEPPQVVGDVVVGGYNLVPKGKRIEKGAIVGGPKGKFLETLASSKGKMITEEDLTRLELGNGKAIKKLRDELERVAGEQEWRLDVFEMAGGRREFLGIIGEEEEDKKPKPKQKGQQAAGSEKKSEKKLEAKDEPVKKQKAAAKEQEATKRKKKPSKAPPVDEEDGEGSSEEGSYEEYYKEEL